MFGLKINAGYDTFVILDIPGIFVSSNKCMSVRTTPPHTHMPKKDTEVILPLHKEEENNYVWEMLVGRPLYRLHWKAPVVSQWVHLHWPRTCQCLSGWSALGTWLLTLHGSAQTQQFTSATIWAVQQNSDLWVYNLNLDHNHRHTAGQG